MIVLERTLTVTAAPDVVLRHLTDFANTPHGSPAAQRDDDGPLLPGATWRQAYRFFGISTELTYVLAEATPGRLVFHGRNEGATCVDTVLVRAVPGGAEVAYRVDLELHGLAKLATAMMRAEFEKLGNAGAAALSQALNGLPSAPWHPSTIPPPAPA